MFYASGGAILQVPAAATVVNIGTATTAAGVNPQITGVNVPAGATIFCFATNGEVNSNAPAATDSVNGTHTRLGETLLAGGTLNGSCMLSYFINSALISNGTITFPRSGTGSGFANSLSAFYATGLSALKAGSANTNSNTGTGASVFTGVAAAAGEFVVAGVGDSAGSLGTQDLAFTSPFTFTNFIIGGHRIAASAGVVTYAPTNPSSNWGAVIGIFH